MKPRILDFLPAAIRNRRNLTFFGSANITIGIVAGNLGHSTTALAAGVLLFATFLVAMFSRGDV